MGLLDGKVAIVTGGGNGIGRQHCLALAAEGAKVVVNDLGKDRSGAGEPTPVAEKVVAEIEEAGGEAAANLQSVATVEGAKSIVQTALDAFGRVDILVNNAGILRDKTLLKMTEEMWDPVIDVHLKGTFLCTRFAAEQMKAQGDGGRIISTSSLAGLKGNFGQTNYAAAKAGIYGMTRVWSMELARAGITANAIAPVAVTRMTEDLGVVPEEMTPEKISPIVVFLASDLAADINGQTFGVHGNEIFEYKMEQSPSMTKPEEEIWTAQEIAERLPELEKTPEPAAGGGGDSIGAKVKGVFSAMPKAFRADKAGDWEAVLHFEVGEAGVHTLAITDGACSYTEGAAGEATCTVTFDKAETLVGMIEGTVKPEQAFMSGKMKATSMGDLMKFGKAFDFKKASALAQEALGGGGGAADDPKSKIGVMFDHIGEAFVPERAGDWSSTLHFEITGTGDWAVEISDGEVRSAEAKPAHADATITFASAELFLDLAAGKAKPEQAFMAGKIKTNNMGELMKFGKAFDLSRAAEAMSSGELDAAAGGGSAASGDGLNKDLIGKRYRLSAEFVEPKHTIAYAKATNDLNPRYVDESVEGGLVAPPLFAVRPAFQSLIDAVSDDELNADLLNLVHGEQDMIFHDVLRPWDLIAPRAVIESIEEKSSGQLLNIRQLLMREGDPVVELESGLFIRDRSKSGGKKKKAPAEETEREIIFTATETVDEDQPLRYAEASLDKNPIHVDPKVAKAAGHPSVILHGLCTMAFTSKAIVDNALDGDPRGLKRLKVRFSKVVLPGQELTTRVWEEDASDSVTGASRVLGFETVNDEGEKVITNGIAELTG